MFKWMYNEMEQFEKMYDAIVHILTESTKIDVHEITKQNGTNTSTLAVDDFDPHRTSEMGNLLCEIDTQLKRVCGKDCRNVSVEIILTGRKIVEDPVEI